MRSHPITHFRIPFFPFPIGHSPFAIRQKDKKTKGGYRASRYVPQVINLGFFFFFWTGRGFSKLGASWGKPETGIVIEKWFFFKKKKQ